MSVEGEKTCSQCDAPMQEAQDWCLRCGFGVPRGAGTGPGWRSAALAIGATGALALGASAAAYAALQQQSPAKRATAVAQAPATTTPPAGTTPTPGAAAPGATTPTTPKTSPSPSSTPLPSLKTPSVPPKIPSSTPTPTGGGKNSTPATAPGGTGGAKANGSGSSGKEKGKQGSSSNSSGGISGGGERVEGKGEPSTQQSQPVAILLDTDAAHLYNPGKLPATRFGDPSLAIDGDSTTAWTVQLEPTEAPAVGAGLTLALNTPLSIGELTLIAETVGITVQIYGSTSVTPPESLAAEGWVRLSKQHLVKKRKATIKLSESKQRFKQLLVWIVKAPTSSSGQFIASEVAIDEIQLYESKPSGH